jgi:hypothetical protein
MSEDGKKPRQRTAIRLSQQDISFDGREHRNRSMSPLVSFTLIDLVQSQSTASEQIKLESVQFTERQKPNNVDISVVEDFVDCNLAEATQGFQNTARDSLVVSELSEPAGKPTKIRRSSTVTPTVRLKKPT